MIVLVNPCLKHTRIHGITLFPFIILRSGADKGNAVLINHERIHIRQQLELLIIFFYLLYSIEYLFWYIRLGDGSSAYRRISFEREAYAKERDFGYLRQRKLWSFLKYF